MNGADAIRIAHLWTQVGQRVVHRDLNLEVRTGEVMALIGSSGSGKTTLLREMLGLSRPTRGSLSVLGDDLTRLDRQGLEAHALRCGVVFQSGALFSALTALENVALPVNRLRVLSDQVTADLALLSLQRAGIDAADATKLPAQLSGGMVKRVALARALVLEPELLFLDEPTAGLDPDHRNAFVKLIHDMRRALDLTVVMVTHDVETVIALADRVAVLADQTIVVAGPLAEVVHHPHPFVQHFFLSEIDPRVPQNVEELRSRLGCSSV
jgi:phospholipid/cholesterol/gamma-HCH transport system ATP-binding protein